MTRKLTRRLFFCWAACLAFATSVCAERLPLKVYTSADGLGSSFVNYLMRDSRGFMWFCTRDGLSRFDGSRFVTYQIGDNASPPGIETIYEDRKGLYWVGTTVGLYRFNPSELLQPRLQSKGKPVLNAQFMGPTRAGLYEDGSGGLWAIGDWIYWLEEQNGQVSLHGAKPNFPEKHRDSFSISGVDDGKDGSLWISSTWGVLRRLPDGRLIYYAFDSPVDQGYVFLMVDKQGRVWHTRAAELYVFNPAPAESFSGSAPLTILPFRPTTRVPAVEFKELAMPQQPGEIFQYDNANLFAQSSAKKVYQSQDDHIWITAETKLIEFDGRMLRAYSGAHGLLPGMRRMAEDTAGNLWIAGQAGLHRLDRRGLTSYTEADGLNSVRLYAISEGPDGKTYFSNGDFYLSQFDGRRFRTVRPKLLPNQRSLWSTRNAMIDRTGQWWILTHEKLYRFAPVKDFAELNGKSAAKTYDRRDGLKSDGMFQIFEDSKGDIWVSVRGTTDDERGLARWNRAEDRFHTFSESEGFPRLKSPSAFAEDNAGNLWIGFYDGGGVVRYKNGRFEEFSENAGLPPAIVTDLHLDRAGRLWLSSGSGGMRRVDDPGAENPRFVSLTTDNGLSSNNVRTITEDSYGDIYAGTVRGIDRISPGAERIKHYSINDGLASDFVVDSSRDSAGTLWFATTSGLSRFVPSTEQVRSTPPIWLGSLRVAGVEQPISILGSVNLGALELTHTQNNLQIEFFGMDFSAGETLRYQFMLEGADSGWATATEQRTVSYANLQPGKYRFLVRAINSDGVISERPAAVSFSILAPIWLRWWFIALAVLLVFALFYLLYRYRLARLREVNAALAEAKRAEEDLGKAREDRLTELERVRTRIATDLHDDIGASLTQIAILSEVAQQGSKGNGASLEPLKSIASVSNELVETMSDIVWAINPRKDHLQDLIQRMRRFASDILSARGISLQFEAPTFAPEIPLGANARREVFLIFKESLNNIVKHSGATQVRIEVEFSADSLMLKIVDNGQGFDPANVSAALFAGQKGGHGILSMKERAAEMNARFDIDASAGKGTVVTFRLPLDAVARHSREAAG